MAIRIHHPCVESPIPLRPVLDATRYEVRSSGGFHDWSA